MSMAEDARKVTADIERMAKVIADNGRIERYRVWSCRCGQRNRVDAAKVIGMAAQPRCGKCKMTLKPPP